MERASALRHLRAITLHARLTVLTDTKNVQISQAAVLVEMCPIDGESLFTIGNRAST